MRILTNLKGWTNGEPLVKLVKGEGRATRARSLAAPRRAVGVASRNREAYAQFLSFMSVIHVSHNPLY
jgi:hypothetical protein